MQADAAAQRRPFNVARMLDESGALVGLVVLVVTLSLLSDSFLTGRNLIQVGIQAAVVAVLAFGQTFVVVAGGIDLSVGSVAAFTGIVGAYVSTSLALPGIVGVLAALGAGLGTGLVNGTLVAYGGLPPFIATLAMLSAARGLALVVSQGQPTPTADLVTAMGDEIGAVIPIPVLIMALMGVLCAIILNRTYSGRAMYAIGGNTEAARLSGINVARQRLVVFALSGVFAGVAGLLLSGRLASAQPQAAEGYELDAIAAVVIGGASLSGGRGRALGTFIGALILAVLRNGLNLLGVSAFWQLVVIGAVIAFAVLLDTFRRRRSRSGG